MFNDNRLIQFLGSGKCGDSPLMQRRIPNPILPQKGKVLLALRIVDPHHIHQLCLKESPSLEPCCQLWAAGGTHLPVVLRKAAKWGKEGDFRHVPALCASYKLQFHVWGWVDITKKPLSPLTHFVKGTQTSAAATFWMQPLTKVGNCSICHRNMTKNNNF